MPLLMGCFVDLLTHGLRSSSGNLDVRPAKREEKVLRRQSSVCLSGNTLKKTIALKTGVFIL